MAPPSKASVLHSVKKFHKEGTVKNLPYQQCSHIPTPIKMSEIRMKFSTIHRTSVRKVSAQVKTSHSLIHEVQNF